MEVINSISDFNDGSRSAARDRKWRDIKRLHANRNESILTAIFKRIWIMIHKFLTMNKILKY